MSISPAIHKYVSRKAPVGRAMSISPAAHKYVNEKRD